MFPTHVGMNRILGDSRTRKPDVPHTRGDEPVGVGIHAGRVGNVPHTRGDEPWTERDESLLALMFPTHVGMNRQNPTFAMCLRHVPHTRGDEPPDLPTYAEIEGCSPHTWG